MLTRRAGMPFVVRAWCAATCLALPVVFAFYLERVEGIRSARAGLAMLLVVGWLARVAVARASVAHVAPHADLMGLGEPPRLRDAFRLAAPAAALLIVFLFLPAFVIRHGVVGLLLAAPLPLLGAVAPTWMARAALETRGGIGGYVDAARDTKGFRFSALAVDAIFLASVLVVCLNLYGVVAFGLLVFRSFLGLDVGAVEQFLSPSNAFLLVVLGCVGLSLFEPMRVGLSVVLFSHVRARRDGHDLRRSLDELAASAPAERTSSKAPYVAALLLVAVCSHAVGGALAQPPVAAPDREFEPPRGDPESPGFEGGGQDAPPPEGAADEHDGSKPPTYTPFEQPADEVDPLTDDYAYEGAAVGVEAPIAPVEALPPGDRAVAADVDAILARPEFREFVDLEDQAAQTDQEESSWLSRLWEAFLRWLNESAEEGERQAEDEGGAWTLPGGWFFLLLAGLLLLAVGIYLYATRPPASERAALDDGGDGHDPRERPPDEHLDDAATLAGLGRYRDALRSLYLATLVALDRRGVIAFDPTRTNWHYLRQMRRGPERDDFRKFTRLFDHKWYGDEPATRADYELGRRLADTICRVTPAAAGDGLQHERDRAHAETA